MAKAGDWFRPADTRWPPRIRVIAELGVNHDGRLDRALQLVEAAARAKADAVKVQVFEPGRLLSAEAVAAAYQGGAETDPREMLEQLTLDDEQLALVRDAAWAAGLKFVATPFSLADIDRLEQLNVDAIKIASPDAVNPPLIRAALKLAKPIIVSTGTCELAELRPAAELLQNHSADAALLQCVSAYPTPSHQAALGGIAALAHEFHLPVGYSDHTTELHTGAIAVAAGALILEKHLTHDQSAPGPDHAASLTGSQFTTYVTAAHDAAAMLGPSTKRRLDLEQEVHHVSRQSLCATEDLPAGHILTDTDLTLKRPGTGLPPDQWQNVVGKRLTQPITADHLLQPDHLD